LFTYIPSSLPSIRIISAVRLTQVTLLHSRRPEPYYDHCSRTMSSHCQIL
jgi:hypothetical protein